MLDNKERGRYCFVMTVHVLLAIQVLLMMPIVGCSCGPVQGAGRGPDPANYDRSCQSDDDCVIVTRKMCATDCECPDIDSINRRDEDRYREDNAATQCIMPPGTVEQCSCISLEPGCDNGECALCPYGGESDGGCRNPI